MAKNPSKELTTSAKFVYTVERQRPGKTPKVADRPSSWVDMRERYGADYYQRITALGRASQAEQRAKEPKEPSGICRRYWIDTPQLRRIEQEAKKLEVSEGVIVREALGLWIAERDRVLAELAEKRKRWRGKK